MDGHINFKKYQGQDCAPAALGPNENCVLKLCGPRNDVAFEMLHSLKERFVQQIGIPIAVTHNQRSSW